MSRKKPKPILKRPHTGKPRINLSLLRVKHKMHKIWAKDVRHLLMATEAMKEQNPQIEKEVNALRNSIIKRWQRDPSFREFKEAKRLKSAISTAVKEAGLSLMIIPLIIKYYFAVKEAAGEEKQEESIVDSNSFKDYNLDDAIALLLNGASAREIIED